MKARTIAGWTALISGVLLVVAITASALVAGTNASASSSAFNWMMGFGAANVGSAPGPGALGFVAGTTSAPRVVRIIASGQLRFIPDVVAVQAGETITFQVTTMGMSVHEFMVGPAAGVAADTATTPEVADIGMMRTKSLTYTFSGPGSFAYACHAPSHYEAGMKGTIVVVP